MVQQFERLEIKSDADDQWGYLVKTWATGVSRFPNPQATTVVVPVEELQPPRDLADLKRQLARVGLANKVKIPAHITSIATIQFSPEVFVIRLPPKVLIEQGEKKIKAAETYPIPNFYRTLTSDRTLSDDEKLRLHACRIGEYTINTCQ